MGKIEREMKRLEEKGVIDSAGLNAKEIGLIIDTHNQSIDKHREKEFLSEVNARNEYYWKLWRAALNGDPDYKQSSKSSVSLLKGA